MTYIGRFAPSPTGSLHIGSLVTAVGSYIHAKQFGGKWVLRIEDIDQIRTAPGATDSILKTLDAYQLEWDGEIRYQSPETKHYIKVAEKLILQGLAFKCSCSRKKLKMVNNDSNAIGIRCQSNCWTEENQLGSTSIRVIADSSNINFVDYLQGIQKCNLFNCMGDYVIVRRDSVPSYHLATVLSDDLQGITTIVRGIDLLELTAIHIHLQQILRLQTPNYLHLPVIVNSKGQKLSKQTGAAPVDNTDTTNIAVKVLNYLGLQAPKELIGSQPKELWNWAIKNWDPKILNNKKQLKIDTL